MNRSVLSPLILFPVLWIVGALLSQIHLLHAQTGWNWTMAGVVAVVPLAFVAGGIIGLGLTRFFRTGLSDLVTRSTSEKTVRLLLLAFVVIGFGELAHQFVKIGGIPLVAPDGNVIRFNQGGPSIILTNLLTVAGVVSLVRPKNILSKDSRFELFIAVAALSGFTLQAGRGSIAHIIIAVVAARWIYWGRPKTWLLSGSGLAVFGILTFGFYLRTRGTPYHPLEAELFSEILPGMPFLFKPFVPLYLAITTNFHALQGIVNIVPDLVPFGGGSYNLIGFDLFIPGTLDLSSLSSQITPPWITSTVAGSLWADGGFPVVIGGIAMTGIISVGAFTMAVRTRSLAWCLAAANLLYVTIFGIYTNLWTQQVDWLMVTPLLVLIGFAADTRDGTTPFPDRASRPDERIPLRTWLRLGAVAVLTLILSAVITQRLLPKPLPITHQGTLTAVESVDWLMSGPAPATGSDPTEVEDHLYRITKARRGSGHHLQLRSQPLSDPTPGQSLLGFRPAGPDSTFEIAVWQKRMGPALFELDQRRSDLQLKIHPLRAPDRSDAGVDRSARALRAPVPRAKEGVTRDYAVSTWTGAQPDLFVIDRIPERKWMKIRILSGESGFKRTLLNETLTSRTWDPAVWSVTVGAISSLGANRQSTRPDLVMIHHEPAQKFTDVWLLPGENEFKTVNYQRDIDLPGNVSPETGFMIGDHGNSPTLSAATPVEKAASGEKSLRRNRATVTVFDLKEFESAP